MTAPSADAIFLALADVDPADRAAALDRLCAGDSRLRADVEAMLAGIDVPDDFLDPAQVPAVDPTALDGPLQPGTLLGDLLVLRALGSGGMGIVYAAQQERPRRTVAVKVLRAGMRRRDVMRRFEREADVLGRLQHPGIAQVHAFHPGDRTTPAHLVMELVAGPPITEYCEAHALPLMRRLELTAAVCDAVQHAHDRGIIHRDLKPANVLVDDGGQPKVLDFGIARASGLDLQMSTIQTMEGQWIGTLAYMSPEQLRARPDEVDTRSDVYALGVLIYRVVAGRLPFDIVDVPFGDALRRMLDGEPVPLGLVDADLRGPLEQIVGKAMAREPMDRYASAAALANDLRRFVDGRPVSLVDPRIRGLRHQVDRYRRAVLTSAAALVVVGTVAGYAVVQRRNSTTTLARMNAELAQSRIERGRRLAANGRLLEAESVLWPEYFRSASKDYPRWALRELYSRQPVLWTAAAHAGAARLVRFSPDDAWVLTAGDDGAVVIWTAANGRAARRIDAHRGPIRALTIARDREWIITGGDDSAVHAWRMVDGRHVREFVGNRGAVRSLDVNAVGQLATADEAGMVRVWSSLDGDDARVVDRPHTTAWCVRFTPDGERLVIAWDDGRLEERNARSLNVVREIRAHDGAVWSLAFSGDRRLLASSGADQTIRLWDATTLRAVASQPLPQTPSRTVAVAADGRETLTTGWLQVDRFDAHGAAASPLGVGQQWLDAEFDHGAGRLATVAEDGTLRVWQTHSGAAVAIHRPDETARNAVAKAAVKPAELPRTSSPDGRIVAVARASGLIDLLHGRSNARVASLTGHVGGVRALAFDRTGELLASTGGDGEVRVFNVLNGLLLMTPIARSVAGTGVTFQPDGRLVVTWMDGRADLVDIRYFDRHVAGNEPYQRSRATR